MAEYTGKLWYDDSKDLHEGMIGLKEDDDGNSYQVGYILPDSREEYGKLIVSAVNACISLNPENPLAVAEGMEGLIKASKLFVFNANFINASPDEKTAGLLSVLRNDVEQALASIERGK